MLVVGRRVIPMLLHYVAHTGSRELFRLAVFAISLGVAFGAALVFDVSFALGAFFAGMILSEVRTQPARRRRNAAAARCVRGAVLRLGRHAVRSGDHPAANRCRCSPPCSSSCSASRLAAFGIVRLFGYPTSTALTISARWRRSASSPSFSSASAWASALLPDRGRDLVLAGAIILDHAQSAVLRIARSLYWPTRPSRRKAAGEQAPAAADSAEKRSRASRCRRRSSRTMSCWSAMAALAAYVSRALRLRQRRRCW